MNIPNISYKGKYGKVLGLFIIFFVVGITFYYVLNTRDSANSKFKNVELVSFEQPKPTTKTDAELQKDPENKTPTPQPQSTTPTVNKQTTSNQGQSSYSPKPPMPTVSITSSILSYEVLPDSICTIKVRSTMISDRSGIWGISSTFTPEGYAPEGVSSQHPNFTAGQPIVVEHNWAAVVLPHISRVTVSISLDVRSGMPQQQINFTPPPPITIDC